MKPRPPQLSPRRIAAGLLLPLAAYLALRALIGSATGALAITEAGPAAWLVFGAVTRRRVDPIAVLSTLTVAIALAAYALSGGDPLALKLRRGMVTGTVGIAWLASLALGRPLLLILAGHAAKANPDIAARLADPARRRAMVVLTAIIGLTFGIDGATQIALALTVPTGSFVADSTAVRILVLGTGAVLTVWYLRRERERRQRAPRGPSLERDG